MSACAASAPTLPPPRPIVNHQGARIRADHQEMKRVNEWVTREQTNIVNDPSFWVVSNNTIAESFPWEGMRVAEDSVFLNQPLEGRDAQLVYQIYGHLHLMVEMEKVLRERQRLVASQQPQSAHKIRAITAMMMLVDYDGSFPFASSASRPSLPYPRHHGRNLSSWRGWAAF